MWWELEQHDFHNCFGTCILSSYVKPSYLPPQVLVNSSLSVTHQLVPSYVLEVALPIPVSLTQVLLVWLQPGVDQPSNVLLQTRQGSFRGYLE